MLDLSDYLCYYDYSRLSPYKNPPLALVNCKGSCYNENDQT